MDPRFAASRLRRRSTSAALSFALLVAWIAAFVAPASIAAAAPPDWPTYHNDATRSGVATGFPAVAGRLARSWVKALDGPVYAEPLVVHGILIAATENDSVYGLDPRTGAIVWRRNLGRPVPVALLPCGNVDPLGITSTPVFDGATDTLFVSAETRGPQHVLVALDPRSGGVRWSRSIEVPGGDPAAHQQRAALAVGNGYVYVGFGGLAGPPDACGTYQGRVVGIPVNGRGATLAYRVPVARGGGIWATGGPAMDAAGHLYVAAGNGSETTRYDGSDSVLELSSQLHLLSRFAPAGWSHDNAVDADLGSMSPVLLPSGLVFISGKSGIAYVLRQGALGGIGGQLAFKTLCRGFGSAAHVGDAVYVPCTDGIRRVTISSRGEITPQWRTSTGTDGPPVIGGGAIWSIRTAVGVLYALSPTTGNSIAQVTLGPVPHFATPTLWNGHAYVGTMTGMVAVRATA